MSDEPAEADESASDATEASAADSEDETAGAGEDTRPDDAEGTSADDATSETETGTDSTTHVDSDSGGDDPRPTIRNPAEVEGGTAPERTASPGSGESADESDEAAEPEPSGETESAPASAHAPIGAEAPTPDRGGTVTGQPAGAGGGGGGGSIFSGGIGGSAPPDDEEMPLTEHIEEMLVRLTIVVVFAGVATLLAFPFADDLIIEMWYDVHDGTVSSCKTAPESSGCVPPHVYGPLELVLTRIRVAGLAGLLVALPVAVYQTYRFMRPGLYPDERRYYLAAVPFSLVLGVLGMLFAYFVVLPLLFAYFISYTQGSADLAFQLAETMSLVLVMMGMLAIVFQIPLLIMLAIMMGITSREWLERRRLYFWGLFLGVGVIFGPDPTGMAPVLLAATMVVLFEGTLLLLRWTGR